MLVIVKDTYEAMSKEAARIVADRIVKKPNLVLGLATGSTPLGVYRELIRMHKEEGLDFSKVTTFNLDEYPAPTIHASAEPGAAARRSAREHQPGRRSQRQNSAFHPARVLVPAATEPL